MSHVLARSPRGPECREDQAAWGVRAGGRLPRHVGERLVGRSTASRLGSALIAGGLALLAYALLWQLGLAPGSRVTLPAPVALERGSQPRPGAWAPSGRESPSPGAAGSAARAGSAERSDQLGGEPAALESVGRAAGPAGPEPARVAEAPALLARAEPFQVADRADRVEAAARPRPGYAVRLAIPAIKVDTEVVQAGITLNAAGEPEWETVPFVAAHYGDLTALVGAPGNAVISGHVATINQGNVFRFLYQVDLGDEVQVWDDHGELHRFAVAEVKLVPPTDTSVMLPTPDPTLTLITCGGTFDPVRREFSDRLIVVAKPIPPDS